MQALLLESKKLVDATKTFSMMKRSTVKSTNKNITWHSQKEVTLMRVSKKRNIGKFDSTFYVGVAARNHRTETRRTINLFLLL